MYNTAKSQTTVNHLISFKLSTLHMMMETTGQKESGIKNKKEQFEVQLREIDAKYIRWFGQRNHPFTGETDNIHNYFRYFNATDGSTKLHLKDGLPIEIGKDCKLAFDAIFEN